MPLDTDKYLADTTHLSTLEHGAYMLLLMASWRLPIPALPDDDRILAKYARMGPRTWAKIKPAVMAFWHLSDGQWTQKKQLSTRVAVRKRVESSRANGASGGRPKSLKDNNSDKPTGFPNETHPKASKSKSSSLRSEDSESASTKAVVPLDIQRDFEAWYHAYPRRVGKGKARPAYTKARKTASAEVLLAAAEKAAVAYAVSDPRFVPHPSTWLTGERWLDREAEPARGISYADVFARM